MIVLQKSANNRFSSELIDGRYQVLESGIVSGSFFIYDHQKEDELRGRDDTIILFDSLGEATDRIANLGGRDATDVVVPAAPQRVARAGRTVTEKPAKKRKESALSYLVELLATETDDNKIVELVKQRFSAASYNASFVKWKRKQVAS